MVYCGKPSKACHACRARKTRCDAKPDGCTQCFKGRRTCPGYRSQIDVIFHDQSANVVRKAKASEAKKCAAHSRSSEKLKKQSEDSPQREADAEKGELIPLHSMVDGGLTMRPTLEESATCHFVFNYVVGINAPTRLQLDNLAFMYKYSNLDATLTTAVQAVSFASYSHHTRSGELADASMYWYTKAIGSVNAALQCPSEATKDTTLLSIMILGMYEVITGRNQRSIKAWIEHVNGSAALLKLRGMEQLETPIGRRLFVQALSSIQSTSIQLCMPLPKSIIGMTSRLRDLIPEEEDYGRTAYDIQLAIMDANHFRAAVEGGQIDNPFEILSKAVEIDGRFAVMYTNSNVQWHYETIRYDKADRSIVHDGFYHLYADLLTANVWNAMRVMRGLLQEIIRDTLLKGFATRPPTFTRPEHTAQFQASTDMCYQLQAEILASVPQHLGYVKSNTTFSRDYSNQGDSPTVSPAASTTSSVLHDERAARDLRFEDAILDVCKTAAAPNNPLRFADARSSGGLNLMWPLFFATTRDFTTCKIQAYSIKNLRRIGEDMGIEQALVLARAVESQTEIEAWRDVPRVELEDD